MRSDWFSERREEQLLLAQEWITELPHPNDMWTVIHAKVSKLTDLVEDAQNAVHRLQMKS